MQLDQWIERVGMLAGIRAEDQTPEIRQIIGFLARQRCEDTNAATRLRQILGCDERTSHNTGARGE